MAELPPRKRIGDVEMMRALAHPLRSALLDHLSASGPATASECAEAVGSTASNCSWHLRQLAQSGLVEPAAAEDGRERRWRACQVGLHLEEPADDPAARVAHLAVVGASLGHEQELTQRFLDTRDTLDPEWRASTGLSTYTLRVSPAELTRLVDAIDALLRPYVAPIRQDPPPDARAVHVGLRAFPRIGHDGSVGT